MQYFQLFALACSMLLGGCAIAPSAGKAPCLDHYDAHSFNFEIDSCGWVIEEVGSFEERAYFINRPDGSALAVLRDGRPRNELRDRNQPSSAFHYEDMRGIEALDKDHSIYEAVIHLPKDKWGRPPVLHLYNYSGATQHELRLLRQSTRSIKMTE